MTIHGVVSPMKWTVFTTQLRNYDKQPPRACGQPLHRPSLRGEGNLPLLHAFFKVETHLFALLEALDQRVKPSGGGEVSTLAKEGRGGGSVITPSISPPQAETLTQKL